MLREAGGLPQCRPRRRRPPSCWIGHGGGLLRRGRSCVFWRRRTAGRRWWDRSDPAPGRLVLVDPDGLAPAARQRCSWCADAGQAGTQVGGTQPIGSGTGAGQTGECTARAAIGARRGDHRNPKKHSWTAVPPVDVETVSLIVAVGGERPSTFWWCMPRKKTWSMGFCGLESGDAYGDPD